MNTQKVEERPKDLSILARDEEKKDIHRSILRERKKNEKQQNDERRTGDHNSILFLVSLSVPRITPRSLPFPTTHLLVAPFC